jgi:undecaprenyl-diphosphatase
MVENVPASRRAIGPHFNPKKRGIVTNSRVITLPTGQNHPMQARVMCLLLRLFALLVVTSSAFAATAPNTPAAANEATARLSLRDAIVLGVVEGVTEYLPVSSTGHLIITNRLLGLDSEAPLRNAAGEPLWYKRPSPTRPAGQPLTLKLAADTYVVVIQFGAIAAVALLYWRQLLAMARGALGQDEAGRRLLFHVLVAFVPAAAVGFLAHDWIDAHLFSIPTVIAAQVGGACVMLVVEQWYRHRTAAPAAHHALTTRQALGIGGLQCAALIPGTSRSMTTIVGGYLAGQSPAKAAEFSFLLGFVTLSAASVYKGWRSGGAMIQVFGWTPVLLGGIVATIVAAVCVRFLVSWLTRRGLGVFAWYRLVVAGVLTALLAAGWI